MDSNTGFSVSSTVSRAAEKTEAHSPQTTSCVLNACCLPTVPPRTLAAPRTRKRLLLSLGVGPTWFPGLKRKELSMTGRPTAQKPPSPRPLSSTCVDSDFAPSPSSQQPLSSAVETALWPQRAGGKGPAVQTFPSRFLGASLCLLGSQSCGQRQRICFSLAVLLL